VEKKGIPSTAVIFELPFCLYIDDGLYELTIDGNPSAIQIFRESRCSEVQDLPFNKRGVILNADPRNCEIKGDRFGRVGYSIVVVSIPSGDLDLTDADPLIDRAVKSINRLIDVYKTVTLEFWIPNISSADLLGVQYRHCDENGQEKPGLIYGGPIQVPGLKLGGPLQIISSGLTSIKRPPETHIRIKDMLARGSTIPTYLSLMLDSQNSIRFGRFHLAVVEAQTAFESFFYSFVKHELVRRGIMTPDFQKELAKPGLTRKLEYFSLLVTTPPRSFKKGVSEHDNWHDKTYLVRNKVIHEGRTDVTQLEAEEAFQAANSAFSFFGQDWRQPMC
jgi:hypothetical protein